MEGAILISRALIDSEVFASEKLLKIWIWLLIKANFKERQVPIKIGAGQSVVTIKRGQVLFGRLSAENELFIDGSTIYKCIKRLEKLKNIEINSNSHFSIITICNYDHYQDFKNYKVAAKEQPSNSQVTAKEQPSNTPNKDNNDNKDNNENNKGDFQKDLIFPFDSEKFLLMWEAWREYKHKQFQFTYKGNISEQSALKKIGKLSQQNELIALEIIEQSMAQGWKGLFELKINGNGKQSNTSQQDKEEWQRAFDKHTS